MERSKIRKIKVCQVSTIPFAIRFLLLDQIKNLQKEGYDVSVVCSFGEWIKDIEANGIPVKPIMMKRKISPFSDLITLFKMAAYFKKQKFDIVHTSTPKAGLLGALAAKIAGVPIIIHSNLGFYFQEDSLWIKKKIFLLIEKITARCCNLVFSVARSDVETALKGKVCSPEKIKYLGWWVNLDKFNPYKFSPEFVKEKKKKLGISPEAKIVGIVARLVKEKGFDELFQAFCQVLKKIPQAVLLIVGPKEPEKKDRINPKEIAKKLGIEKNVFYLGERTDVNELFAVMDIFALPSYREGVAVSVLEALAMEKTVIAAKVGGIPDSVEDKKTGILIPPKNVQELADNLIYFLDERNAPKGKILGRAGRKKVEQEFSEGKVFSRIKEEYGRLVRRNLKLRIKICHISSADMTLKFIMQSKLNFLKDQGYEIHAACSQGSLVDDIRKQGIEVKIINFSRSLNLFIHFICFLKLCRYFKKEKFDIVHTHTPVPGLLGQLAAKAMGVPIIINTIHGFYFSDHSGFFKKSSFILIERLSAKCSDLIFSVSRGIIDTAVKEKICRKELLRYLGRDIDTQRFDPAKFPLEFILGKKKELGINPKAKVIGIVGRLVKEKGYLELFEAFKKIIEKFPQILLLVVGPEEVNKRDKIDPSVVKKFGISEKVLFLGQRTDAQELYSLMDIFVLPSYREGIAASVLEASAMAKPVVASNVGGCPEAVYNWKTGILVPVRNVEKLTEAIIYLLENPETGRKMGLAGREKIKKEFNDQDVFHRMKKEYDRLIGQKKVYF